MATGFPVKANYATGDVLTAANMNDLAGTLNQMDPTAKGDLFPASDGSTLSRLAVGANGTILEAASGETTGLKWGGAASTWTPTLQNITQGNGTITTEYVQVGKIVTCLFRFVLGSTSAISSFPGFTLPVTARNGRWMSAQVNLLDSGTAEYAAWVWGNSNTTTGTIYYLATNNLLTTISATAPFTWTTNDAITAVVTYEAA